jgi:hypothetical protein
MSASLAVRRGYAGSKWLAVWLYLPAIGVLIGAYLLGVLIDVPFSDLSRDPVAVAGGHAYYGFVSNVGVILWSFSAGIGLFTFVLLSRSPRVDGRMRGFVASGALLSFLLLSDDLLMLHERVYPKVFGINEKVTIALYGLMVIAYLFAFWREILRSRWVYLQLALLFFLVSVTTDKLPESLLGAHHLVEDGAKFLGIVSWFGFQFAVCFGAVRNASMPVGGFDAVAQISGESPGSA